LRIVVTARSAAAERALNGPLAAFGADAVGAVGPCDIEISQNLAPKHHDALARLYADEFSASPRAPAGFDGAIALNAPAPILGRQLEAWNRIAIARDECARRLSTAQLLGLIPATDPAPAPAHALFVGPAHRAFLAIQRTFIDNAGALSGTLSSSSGFDHLHDQTFDAVIVNAAANPQPALAFCAALRRNSALFNIPTMLLVASGDQQALAAAIERGACSILETAGPHEAPLGWLLEAVRRERLRRAVERSLRACRDLMADPRTGLWRAEPFLAHIERMASQHHQHRRPMSVVALRLQPAPGASSPTPEAWRNVCAEASSLAGRLVRESDCVTALSQDQLLVAMPSAPFADARRAAERISSVVECTAFAGGCSYPLPLAIEQNAVALAPQETVSSAIARALSPLTTTQLSA
jgi:two-component system cell cycle response regulator PopA